jgi:hypothetical protein
MFAFVLFAAFSGADNFDLIGIRADVAKLKLEVAELKADFVAIKARESATIRDSRTVQPGYVAVTGAKEVHHPGLLNVAGAVATAPLKAVTRTVCGVNGCQTFEVQPSGFEGQTFEVPSQTFGVQGDCSNGNCSSGQCGMQTQRRGFFGRKRGW